MLHPSTHRLSKVSDFSSPTDTSRGKMAGEIWENSPDFDDFPLCHRCSDNQFLLWLLSMFTIDVYYRCLLSMFTIDVYYRYAQGFTIGHMLSLLSLCCRHWSLWDWLLQPGATRCLLQGVHMFIGQSSLRHCSSKSKRCLRSWREMRRLGWLGCGEICTWQCNCHFSAVRSSRATQRRGFWFLLRTSGNPFSAELKVVGRVTVNCHRSWKVWNPACRWSALDTSRVRISLSCCCEATDPVLELLEIGMSSCCTWWSSPRIPSSAHLLCAVLLRDESTGAKMNEKPKIVAVQKKIIHWL